MRFPVKFYTKAEDNGATEKLLRSWSERTGMEFYDYRNNPDSKNYFVVIYISGIGYPVTGNAAYAVVMAQSIANLNGYVKVTLEDEIWWDNDAQ